MVGRVLGDCEVQEKEEGVSWLRAEVEVGLIAPIKAVPKGRIRGLVCLSSASAPSAGLQIYIPGGDEDRGIVAQNCHTEVMTTPV